MLPHKSSVKATDAAPVWRAKVQSTIGVIAFPTCLEGESHDGPKLEAQVAYMSQVADHVTIIPTGEHYAPTLQITLGLTRKAARAEALRRSLEWEKKEEFTLNSLRTTRTIYRWSELIRHEKYLDTLRKIGKTRLDDKQYDETIRTEARKFLDKLKKKGPIKVSDDEAFKLCLRYIEEECAVFVVLYIFVQRYDAILYPYPSSPSITATLLKYKIRMMWLQPELLEVPAQKKISDTMTDDEETILQGLADLDDEVDKLNEICDVKRACLIFILKKAERNLREKWAVTIQEAVSIARPDLILHKNASETITRLIFAPAVYSADMFADDSWKTYAPSKPIDSMDFNTWNESGIINLAREQHEQVMRLGLQLMAYTATDEEIFEILKFFYSSLVYKGCAPRAKIYLDEETSELKFTFEDDAEDSAAAFDRIFLFLRDLVSDKAGIIEEIFVATEEAVSATEELVTLDEKWFRNFIRVLSPTLLAKLVYDKYQEVQHLIGSDNSSGVTSGVSTPLLFSQNTSPIFCASGFSSPNPSPTHSGFSSRSMRAKKTHISPNKPPSLKLASPTRPANQYSFMPVEVPIAGQQSLGRLDVSKLGETTSDCTSPSIVHSLQIHSRNGRPLGAGAETSPFRRIDFTAEVEVGANEPEVCHSEACHSEAYYPSGRITPAFE